MKVSVDIPVFTQDEAIGQINGEVELPIVPHIGDVVNFDVRGADLSRHHAAFGMDLTTVTNRLIWNGADGAITIMLSDIMAKNRDEALQIMAFFEDCHGLFANRWDEEDLKEKQ